MVTGDHHRRKAPRVGWTGRYSDYREFNGFRVPCSVEVTWELEKEPFCYARFRVTVIEYNAEFNDIVQRVSGSASW